jgi:hypothetical protein
VEASQEELRAALNAIQRKMENGQEVLCTTEVLAKNR